MARTNLSLTVVCLLFGLALMLQFRTESRLRQIASPDAANDLAAIAGDLYDSNSALRQEVDQLLAQRAAAQSDQTESSYERMSREFAQLQAFNGVVPANGPGVSLAMSADLRPEDLQDLLNEFRNAGAEAIAIGNQRVVYNTAIGGRPGRLRVNDAEIQSPIRITAIGAPEVLDRALARKGGMLSYLRTSYPQATFTLRQEPTLTLPAFTDPFPIRPTD